MDSHPETSYPVLFSDGEQYVDAGHVGIRGGTQFKSLQIELSQKTGVPPHRMSVVLVCRKKGSKTSEKKKVPINDNTNFPAIVSHHNPRKDQDCFLLVSVRRSRRDRERRGRNRRIADDDGSGSSRDDLSPPGNAYSHRLAFPEKMLRRDPMAGTTPDLAALGLFYAPAMDGLLRDGVSFGSYGSSGLPMYSAFDNTYPYGYGLLVARMAVGAICEVCLGATKGRDVPFHPCIYDEIVEIAHRPSLAGPIERPWKSRHNEIPAEFQHSSLILN